MMVMVMKKYDLENEIDEWIDYVRWLNTDSPFTAPGDSGSLVYVMEGGVKDSLGYTCRLSIGRAISQCICQFRDLLLRRREGWLEFRIQQMKS